MAGVNEFFTSGGVAIAIAALVLGCASPGADEALRTGNSQLDAMLAAEAPADESPGTFVSPDRGFRIDVPFTYEHEAQDGYDEFFITYPDSGETFADCSVHLDGFDIASTVQNSAANSRAYGVELTDGAQFNTRMTRLVGGHVDGHPYHGGEWLMLSNKGSMLVKVWAGTRDGAGVLCNHISLGYRETTLDVFETLLGSLEVAAKPPSPYFREVAVTRLRGLDVGVESLTLTLDEDGDTEIRRTGSLLFPVDEAEVTSSTSFRHSWARPDGKLIRAFEFSAENGELQTELQLGRDGEGQWRVAGTFQGQEIDSEFPIGDGVDTVVAEAIAMTRTLSPNGEADRVALDMWMPDIDPTTRVAATLSVPADDPTRAIVEAEGLRIEATRDARGMVERGTIEAGGFAFEIETVHRSGELR